MISEEIEEYYWNYTITSDLVELRNICAVAGIIIDSALARKESRGLHYTLDFQEKDERLAHDTVVSLASRPAAA
jgi:L-aspartate oxidase